MAVVAKNYLDFTGLSAYDALIKAWSNSENQIAYKTVLKSTDGNSLLFYKKPNAIEGTDTPDKTIALGNTDMQTQLDALATIVGATYNSSTKTYSIDLDSTFDQATVDVVDALNELKGQINVLNGADTVQGSVAKSIKDAVEGLDVTEFPLAEVDANGVVTIHGISESDGEIAVGANSANDIVLEEVAYTGEAGDVSTEAITDHETTPTTLYEAGTVQGVLDAIANDLHDLESESVVDVVKQNTAELGYFATYYVTQNGVQVGEKINIPKDYLVKSASVQTVTVAGEPYPSAEIGDKYLDFVINTRDASVTDEHLYIPLDDIMKAISGGTNAETTVSIDAHNVITVTINTIQATKINYVNSTSGSDVNETVQAALARIDGADTVAGSIKKAVKDAKESLDGTAGIASVSGEVITIKGGVTEADGVIDNTSGADDVTISPIATNTINGLFNANQGN